jgi:hypothetical protein
VIDRFKQYYKMRNFFTRGFLAVVLLLTLTAAAYYNRRIEILRGMAVSFFKPAGEFPDGYVKDAQCRFIGVLPGRSDTTENYLTEDRIVDWIPSAHQLWSILKNGLEDYPSEFSDITGGRAIENAPMMSASTDMVSGYENQFSRYDFIALEKVFDYLYGPPNERILGIRLQKYYDTLFKKTAREFGNNLAMIKSRQEVFNKLAIQYREEFLTRDGFDGYDFTETAMVTLFKNERGIDASTVGMLLRRQIDGSLPSLKNCYIRMIKDYDPDFYNRMIMKI